MKLELREFQESAVEQLLTQASLARAEVASGASKPQTLVLASPTGSGKTLMATAFIERVLAGDDQRDADPEATFLWFSYQPDLNDQTREKMIETSTVLAQSDLITVEADGSDRFDQERFEPGRVYLVNAQKLGRDKRLITEGEDRTYTFWQTIKNTRAAVAASFYVIIDEAHKGTAQAGADAETIMQKLLLGSEGEIPPLDLILGISATPQSFQQLAGHERIPRPVTVHPQAVRESGLLKDLVALFHPDEAGPTADYTLVEEAANRFALFTQEWAGYCETEAQTPICPILVVQVEDAARERPTATDLEAAVESIERGAGDLADVEIAHAFQEGAPITAGDRTIRHLRPAAIDADPDVRVVFFKQSLNTGWDCPRAEVMMSFRRARDRVHIAQLIGRMVRAPLARRIETTEFLNSIGLYLPRFDAAAVKDVVEYLTQADTDHGLPVDAASGRDVVECQRIDNPELVAAYEELPSLTVPRDKTWSDRRRLLRLGRLLAEDGLDPDAEHAALETVLSALESEWKTRKGKNAFKDALDAKASLVLKGYQVEYGGETAVETAPERRGLAAESVVMVFAAAGRKLGNGLHLAYLKRGAQTGGSAKREEIKLALATLVDDETALAAVDTAARAEIDGLMVKHRTKRRKLPPDRRALYDEIQRKARDPEVAELVLPTLIQVARDEPARPKHLFVNGKGLYPGKLNSWEGRVIDEELERGDVVGWLRNIDRKDWALCVPYEYEGRLRALYPDLIVFRESDGEIVADILDPHRQDLDDAWAKAKGLAHYVARYGADHFGRIQVIAVEAETILRIELNDETRRKKALKLDSNTALKELYEQGAG